MARPPEPPYQEGIPDARQTQSRGNRLQWVLPLLTFLAFATVVLAGVWGYFWHRNTQAAEDAWQREHAPASRNAIATLRDRVAEGDRAAVARVAAARARAQIHNAGSDAASSPVAVAPDMYLSLAALEPRLAACGPSPDTRAAGGVQHVLRFNCYVDAYVDANSFALDPPVDADTRHCIFEAINGWQLGEPIGRELSITYSLSW